MTLLFTATHHTNKQSPKNPGDFQKNPPYPGVLNVQLPAPIPRHGVGSPGDDGAPTPGLASLFGSGIIIEPRDPKIMPLLCLCVGK